MSKSYYLTYDQRLSIEQMFDDGFKPADIAQKIGVHLSTLYREKKRGAILHGKEYSADVAQCKAIQNFKSRGRKSKTKDD